MGLCLNVLKRHLTYDNTSHIGEEFLWHGILLLLLIAVKFTESFRGLPPLFECHDDAHFGGNANNQHPHESSSPF